MTTTLVNANEAKENFSELLNRVLHNNEHIVLTRRGKEIAVIIPMSDFEKLTELEEKNDLTEALEALKEARKNGAISLEDYKKSVGS